MPRALFCGREVRGALAGNDGKMAVLKQELKKRQASGKAGNAPSGKPVSRKGCKGMKRTKGKAQPKGAEEQRSVEEECADGKEVLRRAAHRAVARESTAIADQLAKQAVGGDPASTKLLVVLMDGALLGSKKDAGVEAWLRGLETEPEWDGDPEAWVKGEGEGGVEREEGKAEVGEGGVEPE